MRYGAGRRLVLIRATPIALLLTFLPVSYCPAAEDPAVYVGYMHYERDGGCSRTAEFVTWRALLRVEIEDRHIRMHLHARGEEILVARDGRGKGTERINTHKDLTWKGRIGPGEGFRKAVFEAPEGVEWEQLAVGRQLYKPRDDTPKEGFELQCRTGDDELVCRLPGKYGQADYTRASIWVPYYFMRDGELSLRAEPGEAKRRFDGNYVKGVLAAGEKEKPTRSGLDLRSFIGKRRQALESGDEYTARQAARDLIVVDPAAFERYLKHEDPDLQKRARKAKEWLRVGDE